LAVVIRSKMGGGKVENLTLYTFKREADRALFVPSKAFSGISTWMFVGGALLMLYFSSIFFLHPLGTSGSLWIGAIFVAVAGYSVALAMRSWSARNTPLSIMSGGRVSYGRKELCAAGAVRAVRIDGARSEPNEYQIALELADGTKVYLPSQYFGVHQPRANLYPFAAKLAEVLEVPVKESR
jgi:hypothetical protein